MKVSHDAISLREGDFGHNVTGYISVLMHEMLHSLIGIYTCDSPLCASRADYASGHTGHSFVWAEMARLVESFARNRLRFLLDLDVLNGVSMEWHNIRLQQSDLDWPLEELVLDWSELEQHAQWVSRVLEVDPGLISG